MASSAASSASSSASASAAAAAVAVAASTMNLSSNKNPANSNTPTNTSNAAFSNESIYTIPSSYYQTFSFLHNQRNQSLNTTQLQLTTSTAAATMPTRNMHDEPSWGDLTRDLPEHHRIPLIDTIISGGLAGAIADTAMHSMDTIKTKMQGQITQGTSSKYNSVAQSLRVIYAEEGLRGLYSGVLAASAGSLLSTLVYFGSYESLKRKFLDDGANPTVSYLAAAGLADVMASFLYVPSEVVKVRLQIQGRVSNPKSLSNRNYKGSVHAFLTILEKRGLKGLYFGWGATLMRDVPFTALQFTIYEHVKGHFLHRYCDGDETRLKTWHDIVAGGTAGMIAGGVTTPLDVVKTYIMTQKKATPPTAPRALFVEIPEARTASTAPHKPKPSVPVQPAAYPAVDGVARLPAPYYSGVLDAFKGIYKREGMRGLFAGVGPRMIWTGCQSVIMFVAYENMLGATTAWRMSEWKL
ncbi:hypothetical protein HDV05_000959 [Chytridiales sp. JEL 0842]|nr:hypothetical protein HDV05_000959 [Chytridiales sp. JEL 0842]